jgi:hypothetical protein
MIYVRGLQVLVGNKSDLAPRAVSAAEAMAGAAKLAESLGMARVRLIP